MEIVGESAFLAFLAAIGYELYRWLQRGRLNYHRLLAVGDVRPAPRRTHLPAIARLFLGAGLVFFFLWLIPSSAQAEPLTDEIVGPPAEELGIETQVEDTLGTVQNVAEPVLDTARKTEDSARAAVPEPDGEPLPSVPEAPPVAGPPPIPSRPEPAPKARAAQPEGRDTAPAAVGGERDRVREPAAPRFKGLSSTTATAEGEARSMTVDTLETFAPMPASFGSGADGAALGAEPTPSPSPGLGMMAALLAVTVPGLFFMWYTSARHAQGFIRYLAAPPGPPG